MIELREENLRLLAGKAALPRYDRSALEVGIVHLGVGNFHRVHQAPVIDDCLAAGGSNGWAIAGVGLLDGPGAVAKREAYAAQDNLYTVTELVSPPAETTRVIGAMVEYLHAPQDPARVLARLANPKTRVVSLTITEGGYNIDDATGAFRMDQPDVASDLAGNPPRTAFGFIVRALAMRRAQGLKPFTVMSCDNLRSNGDTTRKAIVSFAAGVDRDLATWIDGEGAFPNSMVDRIAPHVTAEDREAINRQTGVDDRLPATCEPYTKWVVEDAFCDGRPPMEIAGVEFRSDVSAYEAVKGRLSNSAHMLMCFPSLLIGYRYVHEAMVDPRIGRLLQNFWSLDAVRLVEPPKGYSIEAFTAGVLTRFANPAIRDRLLRVAGDGASKINVFHAKTIGQLAATGADLTREAFLLACFGAYLKGRDDRGVAFEVIEPRLSPEDWSLLQGGDALALLETSPFKGLGLRDVEAFTVPYRRLAASLAENGASRTLDSILV